MKQVRLELVKHAVTVLVYRDISKATLEEGFGVCVWCVCVWYVWCVCVPMWSEE